MLITFAEFKQIDELNMDLDSQKEVLEVNLETVKELTDELDELQNSDDPDIAEIKSKGVELKSAKAKVKSAEAKIKELYLEIAKTMMADKYLEKNPKKAKALDKAPQEKGEKMIGWKSRDASKAKMNAEDKIDEIKSEAESDMTMVSNAKAKAKAKKSEKDEKNKVSKIKDEMYDALSALKDLDWEESNAEDDLPASKLAENSKLRKKANKTLADAKETLGASKFNSLKKEIEEDIGDNSVREAKKTEKAAKNNKEIEAEIMANLDTISSKKKRIASLEDQDADPELIAKYEDEVAKLETANRKLAARSTDKELAEKIKEKEESLGRFEEAYGKKLESAKATKGKKAGSKAAREAEVLVENLVKAEYAIEEAKTDRAQEAAIDEKYRASRELTRFKIEHTDIDFESLEDSIRSEYEEKKGRISKRHDDTEAEKYLNEFIEDLKSGNIFAIKVGNMYYTGDRNDSRNIGEAQLYISEESANDEIEINRLRNAKPVKVNVNKYLLRDEDTLNAMYHNLNTDTSYSESESEDSPRSASTSRNRRAGRLSIVSSDI